MAIRWADGSVVSVLAIGAEGPRFEPRFGLSQNTAPLSTRQYMDTWLKLGSKGGAETVLPPTPHDCWPI